MSDLKPCPFCGGDAVKVDGFTVACAHGLCIGWTVRRASPHEWNTRALPAVQPVTVRLVFANADATPKTTVLDVSAASVPDIMAWYGAYCSGDKYTVTVDGRNVPMDQYGEPTKGGDA